MCILLYAHADAADGAGPFTLHGPHVASKAIAGQGSLSSTSGWRRLISDERLEREVGVSEG